MSVLRPLDTWYLLSVISTRVVKINMKFYPAFVDPYWIQWLFSLWSWKSISLRDCKNQKKESNINGGWDANPSEAPRLTPSFRGNTFFYMCTVVSFWYLDSHFDFRTKWLCVHSSLIKTDLRFMVFNVIFNNISAMSWWSVLLVEETGVSRENHRPVTSHWQTLPHNVILCTPRHERDSNVSDDKHLLHR